jgi:hypothetical protein
VDYEVARHHGDEFDEVVEQHGCLHVIPVRDYVPRVPQSFDDFAANLDLEVAGPLNQTGPIIEGAIPVVTSSKSFDSYLAAFDKRSNSQPDKDDDCTPEFMRTALSLWDGVAKRVDFEAFDVDESVFDRWLSKMDPPKQARMRKAFLELFECEDDPEYLGTKTLSVKVESLLKRYDNKWAPRLIYAGNDHFNALTGPVAMVLCERLVECFSRTSLGPIHYKMAYKCQDVELAQHLRDAQESGYTECFEADFSANDLRQRKGASVVFDKFCEIVGAPSWFRKLLIDMRHFKTVNFEFGHRAQLSHQLPTGTTITTPRNSVWNATIESVFAVKSGNSASAVILGDDYLGMHKFAVLISRIEAWVAAHPKMKLTASCPQLQGEATLLSRRICVDVDVPCMMPKLGKALARFNVRVSPNPNLSDSAYMAGKALSYAYEFRHFPLLRDIFLERYGMEEDKALLSIDEVSWFTRTSGAPSIASLERSISEEKVLCSEDVTREFLMDAYGVTFGLVDCLAIMNRVVTNRDLAIVDAPQALCVDWE